MYLMDSFFGGQFTTYGTEVIKMTGLEMENRYVRVTLCILLIILIRVDPMAKVFPKMSKCTFHK